MLMMTNSLVVNILVVGVALLLVFAIFYSWQRRKKPAASPPMKPVLKSSVVEMPKPEPVHPSEPEPASQPEPESVPLPEPEPVPQPEPEPAMDVTKAEPVKIMSEAVPLITTVEAEGVEKPVPEKVKKPKPPKRATGKKQGLKIVDIEGIGDKYADTLHAANISYTSDLLAAGGTPQGRRELSEKTGISHDLILEWVNLSDLFRIKGIGSEYSDLLEEAGVDTVVELSHRNAENLHAKILEVNEAKKLVRRPPSLAAVQSWISEAKTLPRAVEY